MAKRNFTNSANPIVMRTILQHRKSGRSANGTPSHPGAQSGLSIHELRRLVQNQPRVNGFTSALNTGVTNVANIKLPGDSRLLLGINFNLLILSAADDTFSFSVNNNKMIDAQPVVLSSTQPAGGGIALTGTPYIPLMQPLSGADDFELVYTTVGIGTRVQFELWYV